LEARSYPPRVNSRSPLVRNRVVRSRPAMLVDGYQRRASPAAGLAETALEGCRPVAGSRSQLFQAVAGHCKRRKCGDLCNVACVGVCELRFDR
jgi:hypothetical protein